MRSSANAAYPSSDARAAGAELSKMLRLAIVWYSAGSEDFGAAGFGAAGFGAVAAAGLGAGVEGFGTVAVAGLG
jgi:hypothetical protein